MQVYRQISELLDKIDEYFSVIGILSAENYESYTNIAESITNFKMICNVSCQELRFLGFSVSSKTRNVEKVLTIEHVSKSLETLIEYFVTVSNHLEYCELHNTLRVFQYSSLELFNEIKAFTQLIKELK